MKMESDLLWKALEREQVERGRLDMEMRAIREIREHEQAELARHTAKMVINIDVGGTKVRTTTSTLKQAPYLEALLRHDAAGTMSVTKTDDGLIFIDRSPELFMMVMEGLRAGGQIFTESAREASQLLTELAFYGLGASCPELNAWESSVTDDLEVVVTVGTGIIRFDSSPAVLDELVLLFGRGFGQNEEFYGRRTMFLDINRCPVYPSLAPDFRGLPPDDCLFRLRGLLISMGFSVTSSYSHVESTGLTQVCYTYHRKKLRQCEHPLVINIELPDHHEPDVRFGIVRTFYTFSSAKYAQTSEASGESRGCRSAPVVKH